MCEKEKGKEYVRLSTCIYFASLNDSKGILLKAYTHRTENGKGRKQIFGSWKADE